MLARTSLCSKLAFFSLTCGLLLGAAFTPPAAATAREDACAAATEVSPGGSVHDYGVSIAELRIFEITTAGTGALSVVAASPGDSAQPKLLFLGTDCLDPNSEDFEPVSEGPAAAVVWITAAETFFVQVSPEDPEETLTGVKLTTRWVSNLTSPSESPSPIDLISPETINPPSTCGSVPSFASGSISASWYGEVTQGIVEWDGDVMSGAMQSPGVLRLVAAAGDDLAADLYKGTVCGRATSLAGGDLYDSGDSVAAVLYPGTYSLVLSPFEQVAGYTLDIKFFALCPSGGDQGDTALCGADLSIGASPSGALDDGGGENDDDDFFTFVLTVKKTVEIESTGSVDTFGSLYDIQGNRLSIDDDEGSGDNFRLVKTLNAGRYFVRVEGVGGAEGSYGLTSAFVAEP